MSRTTVSRIESAIKKLSVSELKEYLQLLNTPYEEFVKTLTSLNLLNDLGAHVPNSVDTAEIKEISENPNLIDSRDEIIGFLKSYFIDKPVNEVFLFGSVARNTHTRNSDIDIYLDFDKSVKISIFDLSKMKIEISIGTGRDTDLVLKGSEYSFVKETIESDKIKIYG